MLLLFGSLPPRASYQPHNFEASPPVCLPAHLRLVWLDLAQECPYILEKYQPKFGQMWDNKYACSNQQSSNTKARFILLSLLRIGAWILIYLNVTVFIVTKIDSASWISCLYFTSALISASRRTFSLFAIAKTRLWMELNSLNVSELLRLDSGTIFGVLKMEGLVY